MITLTRLTGAVFALNPDLVERVDDGVDTVITLVDGTKYLVRENLHEIATLIRDYRASVLAAAGVIDDRRAAALGAEERRLSSVRHTRAAHVVSMHREES
ncbi:MAG TPA: flagellar FlbD family protein [Nocardioides sp.]|jgi:flagellar protein FlbD|nr:flagellar FlbD family protein [Nocardioides sp.]